MVMPAATTEVDRGSTGPSALGWAALDRARRSGPEFGHDLANHAPMVLVILERLGASPARRAAWLDEYELVSGLQPAPADRGRITAANLDAHLGNRGLQGDFRGFFAREIQARGADAVLAAQLPTLVPGIAASALHALMRLAYARLVGDDAETATALGYWSATWLPLRIARTPTGEAAEPATLLPVLASRQNLHTLRPPSDLLWHWMREAAAQPDFPCVVDAVAATPDLLPKIARVGLELMARTMSFEALHIVTSAHWLRLLERDLPDPQLAAAYLFQAVAAVYPKMGFPPLPARAELDAWRARAAPSWEALAAAATRRADEHDISFTFSAREEAETYGDPLYRVLAARRLGLIE